jgi:formate dehydrogenase major subunit
MTTPHGDGLGGQIAGWLNDWSLPRQLFGQPALSTAAESESSRSARPRLEMADTVGTSICPYCAVGCAQLMYAKNGRIIHFEGDPRSPINQGTLCPKGSATVGMIHSPLRLTTVKYRAPYSDRWEEKPLDWAMDRIARNVQRTRDETFVRVLPDGTPVNHTLAIASVGGAALDNEENYLIKKLLSAGLGAVWIENQARICHAASVPSLGASYGWGSATLPQWELANADCVLVMGSNMAENHPIAFRFALQAKAKGAQIIHVDPRFTRTSALADLHAPIRPGTDIAFLGGLIRHILEHDLWFREYALAYTNIATIVADDFRGADELDGVFSGWNPDKKAYRIGSWQYEGMAYHATLAEHYTQTEEVELRDEAEKMREKPPPTDPTLGHPRCVYQIMRRHYSRYTPEMVERVTGCPAATFRAVADALCRNSGREKTGCIAYSVGWTHHTVGTEIIRAACIVQALLGNVGRPGGGVLVLRGHASIQGSTDVPTLYNLLPGYLPHPNAHSPHGTLADYLKAEGSPTGAWHGFPKYVVSLLRAWYGEAAAAGNEWGYQWLPKIVGNHSDLPLKLAMADRIIRGLFIMGQNPVVGGHHSGLFTKGLANLEWLVVREAFETETAAFWHSGPDVEDGRLNPREVGTEVFLLPAALPGEKEGTFTNTHRLVQWHDKVIEAPGDCRSDLWFMFHLGRRLKALYANSTDPKDAPLRHLTWDYPTEGPHDEPDPEHVLKEINGYSWPDRRQLPDSDHLRDDGSTACGCWIYCGAHPADDFNQTRSRVPDGPDGPGSHRGWAYSWPGNRRMLYSRASADPAGRPWSDRKRYLWWDEAERRWVGPDRPDFPPDKPPDYEPDWAARPAGLDAHDGRCPFQMTADGKAALFVPSGLKDGPLPTHYEPVESPVRNPLYEVQHNPGVRTYDRPDTPYHPVSDPRFPHVLTTYRLTEHHCGGMMTRSVPSASELQPEGFCEIPPELARELGVANLDWVVVSTARAEIETRVLVTDRIPPLTIDGRRVYQVGMPYHFGWLGFATGGVANRLTGIAFDPNCMIPESKVLTCGLRGGRLERGRADGRRTPAGA